MSATKNVQKYILVIEAMKDSLLDTLDTLVKDYPQYEGVKLLLLTGSSEPIDSDKVVTIRTDYSPSQLGTIFSESDQTIIAVLCRGDKYVQYLRKVIPYLPKDVLVASGDSLEKTTNKRLMRKAFADHSPEITPRFVKVNDASALTLESVSRSLTYPLIIKPASLASSLMIQRCNDEASLSSALSDVFSSLEDIYKAEGRTEIPEVIVEEFLIGSFYSIDAYVMKQDEIYFTPPVEYLPAESMGIDDFFLYKRWTPVDLTPDEISSAQQAVKKSIQAVGLEYSAVHAELVHTIDGWKMIEIGPRIGRFRNVMYRSGFGIDHGYNDVLIHLGIKPRINDVANRYVAAYSIYPTQEGVLKEVRGLDKINDVIKDIVYMNTDNVDTGKYVRFARNGGHALVEVVFSCESKQQYDEMCQWFEANVSVVLEGGE